MTQLYNVNDYGAYPNGTDATPGFRRAIAAAQANPAGGTVMIPAGIYSFSTRVVGAPAASIQVHRLSRPITIQGPAVPAGEPPVVTLVQQVPGQALMSVHTSSTLVQNITFDCQSNQGGSCFGVGSTVVKGQPMGGNNTTLLNCTALGSSGAKAFTLYYPGPPGATQDVPIYNYGNQVISCTVHDDIADDGFSFSFQSGAYVHDITHFGSRLALFMCADTEIDTYNYTMNPYCNDQHSAQGYVTNGFWITPPSTGVTITDFTTSGQGGIISGDIQERVAIDVTLNNHQFTNTDETKYYGLEVGNVDGLIINGGSFAHNFIFFNPGIPGTESYKGYPKGATGVVIKNAILGGIQVVTAPNNPSGGKSQRDGPALAEATFDNCTFSAQHAPTFSNSPSLVPHRGWSFTGPAYFTINGGQFQNQEQGGFYSAGAPADRRAVLDCTHRGTTVRVVVANSISVAVGETIKVGGIKGITVPDGDYTVTSNELRTNAITFTCSPAPTGIYTEGTGTILGLPDPPVLSVSACSVSGTTITLALNSSAVLAVGETIEVSGITGFTGNDLNGAFVITDNDFRANTIEYSVDAAPRGSYHGGGTVTGTLTSFTISSLAPIYSGLPDISGTAEVGSPLQSTAGTWVAQQDSPQTYTYQWKLNGVAVGGATADMFTPAHAGKVTVTVTATNSTGTTSVTSEPVTVTAKTTTSSGSTPATSEPANTTTSTTTTSATPGPASNTTSTTTTPPIPEPANVPTTTSVGANTTTTSVPASTTTTSVPASTTTTTTTTTAPSVAPVPGS